MLNRRLSRYPALVLFSVAVLPVLLTVSGCTSSSKEGAATEEEEPAPVSKRTKAGSKTPKAGTGTEVVASSASGKSLSPDDVWFPDPIKVASDKTPLGGAPASGAPVAPAAADKPADKPKPEMPAEGGAPKSEGGWNLVTGDLVAGEVKQIKTRMADSLSAVTKYNYQYQKNIKMDASVLSAIAIIVGTKNDGASWKDNAKYVRDLSTGVVKAASGLEKKHYEATKTAWEDVNELLSGNKPAKLPDSAPTVPFSETVNRGGVMKRMDLAFEALKQASTADALKKDQEKVLHEAAMLATLTKVVASPGYPDVEEEDYQKFATAMEQTSIEALNAAKEQNFSAYGDALSRMGKSCNECHTPYRN